MNQTGVMWPAYPEDTEPPIVSGMQVGRPSSMCYAGLVAVIPALDEEGSIGAVVADLRQRGVPTVLVADNGSRDRTAAVAAAAGALVVPAARRGYGSACLAALTCLPSQTRAVVFCDGDGADDMRRLGDLCRPVLDGRADLVVGCRVGGEPGALTPPQIAGNLVATLLLRLLFRRRVSDLGPFRCISRTALDRIHMQDPAYGWTAEMQTKVLRAGLRYREIRVRARARTAGQSKISGRLGPVLRAGWAIITTILQHRHVPVGRGVTAALEQRPRASRRSAPLPPDAG